MKREALLELHYIVPIATVPSILANGILSHDRAAARRHHDISMPEVQAVRANRDVIPGRKVHSYANVYFNARNPMMFKRHELHAQLCVLAVDAATVDLQGAVVADQNAGSNYARFHPAPSGLAEIDLDTVMAQDWRHGNQIATWRHSSRMCAEVLVPDLIPPSLVTGGYVSGTAGFDAFQALRTRIRPVVNATLFFQDSPNA